MNGSGSTLDLASPFRDLSIGDQTWSPDDQRESSSPTLRNGSTGEAVARLQRALAEAGFATTADGDFGPMTERSVRAFQSSRGLVADGVVRSLTWGALDANVPLDPQPRPSPPPSDSVADRQGVPEIALGVLVADVPGKPAFRYAFTRADLIWTAKLMVYEAGGDDDPDSVAVLWAMFNRYALFTHRYYSTFERFIRRYSTTLQPELASKGAAARHYRKGDAVYRKTGGTYKGTEIPKGQLVRHLKIQAAPWHDVKASARDVATRALTGRIGNPGIGLASEFASTKVYYRQRHGSTPTRQQWLDFTNRFAAGKKWTFIGDVGGIDSTKNAFFVQNRVAHLATDTVRVLPPKGESKEYDDIPAHELLEEFEGAADFEAAAQVDDESAPFADEFTDDGFLDADSHDELVAAGMAGDLRGAAAADDKQWDDEVIEGGLSAAALDRAVAMNDHWADRLGWRTHFDRIVTMVGFSEMTPNAPTFAEAVAGWQSNMGLDDDGIIGPNTWAAMRGAMGLALPHTVPKIGASEAKLRSSSWLRREWSAYRCNKSAMVRISILGRKTPVNPLTVDAWKALGAALDGTGYSAQRAWSYKCRMIKGTNQASLHSYGLALDIDPPCHPFLTTSNKRLVRFADGDTHDARCAEVKAGRADTAFTPAQIAAVEAIRTTNGLQVFAWGGRWKTRKDGMHFQINVSPQELAVGLRPQEG